MVEDLNTLFQELPPPAPDDPDYLDRWREWTLRIRLRLVEPVSLIINFYNKPGEIEIAFSDGRSLIVDDDEAQRIVGILNSEFSKRLVK